MKKLQRTPSRRKNLTLPIISALAMQFYFSMSTFAQDKIKPTSNSRNDKDSDDKQKEFYTLSKDKDPIEEAYRTEPEDSETEVDTAEVKTDNDTETIQTSVPAAAFSPLWISLAAPAVALFVMGSSVKEEDPLSEQEKLMQELQAMLGDDFDQPLSESDSNIENEGEEVTEEVTETTGNLGQEAILNTNETFTIVTTSGDITIQLYANPEVQSTVDNLKSYVYNESYDGTVFHRVIEGFMIQGGGFEVTDENSGLSPIETEDPIELQAYYPNNLYTIAMARTSDPDSATSQFFINTVNNDFLNSSSPGASDGYAVFGEVIGGFDVVNEISQVTVAQLQDTYHTHYPNQDIIIEDIVWSEY
jgi:cyclophilin family peptidyl-prolyl cis-trans isomerase